jgi:tetratricopeptide (TPR) repeat protein
MAQNLKLIQGKQINVNLTGSFTGSFTGDGSGLTNLPVQNINTGSLVTTSSFNAFTSSYNTGSFTGSFSGSLFGTASFASTASFAPAYLPLSGGTINGNVTVNGTASIAFLNVTIESASVIYSSGSNQFGDATNDTQTLIGTVIVSGSQQITGSLNVSQGITGSLFGTSSWSTNSLTSSFVTGSNVFGPFGSNSIVSSSFATSSSRSISSSFATSASWAPSIAGGSNTQIQFNSGSILSGTGSFTFNYQSQSLQQGLAVTASGLYSHAEGQLTRATGNYSHTEGYGNLASGPYSHAQGNGTTASGSWSHTEGFATLASNFYSHAKGNTTRATGQYAQSDGNSTLASGEYSHTRGNQTTASGNYSHAEGSNTAAIGLYSHAEGNTTQATGEASHAEGRFTTASGNYSHAEGSNTAAIGAYSHAEGDTTQAIGPGSHAEGLFTTASRDYSHAEGYSTSARGLYSHAEGHNTITLGESSHAEGQNTVTGIITAFTKKNNAITDGQITLSGDETSKFTPGGYLYVYNIADGTKTTYLIDTVNYEESNTLIQLVDTSVNIDTASFGDVTYLKNNENFGGDSPLPGNYSHAEGSSTQAIGDYSHAEGNITEALGNYSHTEGANTQTIGVASHAEGNLAKAIGEYSHAEGDNTQAKGDYSHAEGQETISSGSYSHAEGYSTIASGQRSHAEGASTQAVGDYSHAEGNSTIALGLYSHAEGGSTQALEESSHAEGISTIASGSYSHAEGNGAQSLGVASHAEGSYTTATGNYSHAEGQDTFALGEGSHAEGLGTVALGSYQHVQGQYNISSSAQSAFIIGNGIDSDSRSNLVFASGSQFQITGSLRVSGSITGSLSGTASFAISASWAPTQTIDTSSLATTGSNTFTGNQVITGSLTVTQGITGSLFGTASWATNAITASYALNGGVTQLLAGPNVTLSPTNGLGQVTISSTSGGGGGFNTATGSYGSFYDTTTQTNVAGTARSMSLNTTDISNGVSISGSTNPFNTYIKTENAGVYDIQFSAQVDKTDSGTDEIWIWLRKNGTNLADTATSVQLTGNGAHYVAAWNFFVNAAANDYFQLMWYSPDANVRLHAEAGFGVVPGIPSLIVTVNRVDQFLSNTGSFSGQFSGSFSGSGENLNSIPASAITGLNLSQIATGSVTASVSPTQFTVSSASIAEFTVTGTGVTLGSAITDTHTVTGSLDITGSTRLNGNTIVTGSLDVGGTTRIRTGSGNYVAPLTVENTGNTSDANKNVAIFIGNRGNASNIDDNTNIGIQQKNNTVNNYGIVNFFNSLGNLSAFFGTQFVNHSGSPTGNLIFGTTNSSVVSEKMRIVANGNLLLNTTTDSGFRLDVSGSTRLNGNTIITGSLTSTATTLLNTLSGNTAIGLSTDTSTARLQVRGTGATSATNTLLLQNSSLTNLLTVRDDGSSTLIGRLNITPTASTTSSLVVTGPTVMSGSSNTVSGSVLTVVGSGSAQPVFTVQGSQGELFSVVDSLSGSLFSVNDISGLPIVEVFSDGTTLIGNYLDPMLITTTRNVLTNSGSFTVYSLPTASYDAAFFDYSVRSGSNARAGQIMAIQSGSSVNFTEVTSSAFGTTTGISLGVFVSGSNMVLTGSADTTAWTIKTIVRSI